MWLRLTPATPRFLWSRSPELKGETEAIGRQTVAVYWVRSEYRSLVEEARRELSRGEQGRASRGWQESIDSRSATFARGIVSAVGPTSEPYTYDLPRGADEVYAILDGKVATDRLGTTWTFRPAQGICTVLHAKDMKPLGPARRLRQWIRKTVGL